jgi:hypothetical protein
MRPIVGIGNEEAQQLFLKQNKRHFDEWQLLRPVVEKVFLNRVILPPSDEELSSLADLPEDDPKVEAVDRRRAVRRDSA